MILVLFYLAVGLVFLGCSLYELIWLARCRAECEGVCLGSVTYDGNARTVWRRKDIKVEGDAAGAQKGAATCSPVFRYQYGGKLYEGATFQGFSGRYTGRNFPPKARRLLWVDPSRPERFAVQRTPQPSTLLALAGGLAFLALAAWCAL